MADWRLAVDIGGTFTDVVLLDGEAGWVVVDKTLTTPSDPLDGVRRSVDRALDKAGIVPQDVTAPIVHATTLVTNAIIERKTARAAMVTTSGFADTLLIRNEHRYDMYDLQIEFPEPPVARSLTFEIAERTTAEGAILEMPSEDDIDELATAIRDVGAEAVAVAFLHSYANATNERRVADGLTRRLGMPICASSEVAPQIREYPRAVTTACNAATMPVIGPYLASLQQWLRDRGFVTSLLIMLSNGSVVSADVAARNPIRLVESGPAAGALAAAWYARRIGAERLLSFDMGGTTAKSCLIEEFESALSVDFEIARMYRFKKGSGFPINVPSVDLVEIGAGGGSLAKIDELGLLKVGPESAGAEPGPACYGRIGDGATVTDADLLLGFLDADYFLGGEMPLDRGAADGVLAKLGAALHVSSVDAAAGIHAVVDQNMAAGARMHGVERGVDLRGVTVLAFGGAGPVHACGVAEMLESSRVVFPANASVLSAFGILVTPVGIDLARTLVRPLLTVDDQEREELLEELRAEGRDVLVAAGVPADHVRYRYGIDARYVGQGHEITVWLGEGPAWDTTAEEVLRRFTGEYERVYGLSIPGVDVEVVTWRVSVAAPAPAVDIAPPARAETAPSTPKGTRSARFGRHRAPERVPVFNRADLSVGVEIAGPALIEERETTIVINPGWRCELAEDGSVVATRKVS